MPLTVMAAGDLYAKRLVEDFFVGCVHKTPLPDFPAFDNAASSVDCFVQYFVAVINSGNINQIKACAHLAGELCELNEENVGCILSMHLMTTIFPCLSHKLPDPLESGRMLTKELLFYFQYYSMLEGNWLY